MGNVSQWGALQFFDGLRWPLSLVCYGYMYVYRDPLQACRGLEVHQGNTIQQAQVQQVNQCQTLA